MKEKKLFNIDKKTRELLDLICETESLSATEFLKITVRAWRFLTIFHDQFPEMTDWKKALSSAGFAMKEMTEMKSIERIENDNQV